MEVRGLVARTVGQAPRVEILHLDPPGDREVRVEISAAGICHTDVAYVDGVLPGDLPKVLGHEAWGVVVETGPQATRVEPGDAVVLSWADSCGACLDCERGRPQLCRRPGEGQRRARMADGTPVSLLGGLGSLAEQVVVPETALTIVPHGIDLSPALALLGCSVLTGFGAVVNTSPIRGGESVVVVGCGAVGLSIVQTVTMIGAEPLVAVDPIPAKRDAALRFGATHAVDPAELPDRAVDLQLEGFDVAFEAVGRVETAELAWRHLRRGGTMVVVGAAAPGSVLPVDLFQLFSQEKTLVGSLYGSSVHGRDVPLVLGHWSAGELDLESLVGAELSLDEAPAAVEAVRSGSVLRQVVTFPRSDRDG